MITKVALLPRVLPGLFSLPPVATSAGYRMPHERYFVYGAAFSALLHVAVLYGFRTPPPPPPLAGPNSGDDVARLWDRPMEVELPPPPPPEVAPESKTSKAADPAETEDNAPRATIPEPLSPLIPGLVPITGDLNPDGVAPIKGSLRWEVPKTSASATPKDLRGVLVPLDELDDKPVATTRAAPRYPSDAKRLGLSGTVVLRFVVDHRGNVSDVEVMNADHEEFVRAASEAMGRWKFKPGRKNGRAMSTRMEMPMSFTLSNGS